MQKETFIISTKGIFCLLMLIGMALSVFLKHEIAWDLANYHYYNAFAFLYDRAELDIVPANINTFFNPIIDLPLYFYIRYFNESPNIFYALQGIGCGLFLFILYKVCILLFSDNVHKHLLSFGVLVLALTGQATFIQIGSSTNEVSLAFVILWGLYIIVKMVKYSHTQTIKSFFIAGLIMGIGLGLKPTVVSYCIASGLTLIICYKYLNKPFKSVLSFSLGGAVGYLVLNAWFMYKYFVMYGNPFFPFLNGIFHSPYFFDFNYVDETFRPLMSEFLISPFLWNIKPQAITEIEYYDLRLILYYVMLFAILGALLINKKIRHCYSEQKERITLYVFLFLSMLIWMGLFSNLRYAVVLEAAGAVMFIDLLNHLKKHKFIFATGCIFTAALIGGAWFWPSFAYQESSGKHIDMQQISLPDNTLIKIYGHPSSFIIPVISKTQRFKTVTYYHKCFPFSNLYKVCKQGKGSDFAEYGAFAEKREKMVSEHTGPVVYVYDRNNFDIFATKESVAEKYLSDMNLCKTAKKFGIGKNDKCIRNSLTSYFKNSHIAETNIVPQDIKDNYICKELRNNLNSELSICVPKELEIRILGSENQENSTTKE